MGIRSRIESRLRTSGLSAFESDRKLKALHEAVIQLAREVDNLTDEVTRLKTKLAA
jgi:hypothetical protein